ncbi:MAG: hypothetical protein H6Q90_747, partial [Deltaproteobacteria bacterium]|nr:hypothetical protein [Deltaproteobacteria bacterium]
SVFVACGGGGSSGNPDAAPGGADAPPSIDAPPAGLSGLGQSCDQAAPTCPASAPSCVALNLGGVASKGFCTPKCLTGGTAKGAAMNQFTNINPAPNPAACAAGYSGTVGVPQCGVVIAFTPMDTTIVVNNNYTGIEMGCAIACGTGNACPSGLAPDTTHFGQACVCLPI